ncbi:MAG: DUF3530 family protein [Thalassotalea sp.]
MKKIVILLLLLTCPIAAYAEEEAGEPVATESPATETTDAKDKDNSSANTKSFNRAEIIKAPADLFEQTQNDVKHYLNKTEPLLIGTQEFATLFNASNTANNKGVFILLPDWQQSIASSKNMASLMSALPDLGWATLTIQAMNKPENYPSKALTAKEQLEQNSNTLAEHKKQLSLIITALFDKVADMPGTFILVSEGNHASMLFDIFSDESMAQPNAIILLSAYSETPEADQAFAEALATSEIPVLDLYLNKGHSLVKQGIKLRAQLTDKELKIMYRQQQLKSYATSYYPKENLLIAVKGWLKYIGW